VMFNAVVFYLLVPFVSGRDDVFSVGGFTMSRNLTQDR
jgi:hypothetical protein